MATKIDSDEVNVVVGDSAYLKPFAVKKADYGDLDYEIVDADGEFVCASNNPDDAAYVAAALNAFRMKGEIQ